MKRLVKALLTLLGLVLVAAGVGAILLLGPGQKACKKPIEENLTRAMGAPATIESVSLAPWRQQMELRGLVVSNPQGFKEGPAMQFDRIIVTVDLRSLLSKTPTVESAVLQGGRVFLRYEVGKGTNLQRLAENAAQANSTDEGQKEGSAGFFDFRKEFVIKDLSLEEAHVELSSNLLPLSSVELDLVSFSLHDVSKDKPVNTADLTVVVLRSLLKEVVTLKGILAPIAEAVGKEVEGWFGDEPEQAHPTQTTPK